MFHRRPRWWQLKGDRTRTAYGVSKAGVNTLTMYVAASHGKQADVADLVVFLASDESRYITGQMIAIDGGMSAHVGSAGQEDR